MSCYLLQQLLHLRIWEPLSGLVQMVGGPLASWFGEWVEPSGHYVFSHQANEVTAILRSQSIIPLFKSGTFVYWANLKASACSNKTQLLAKIYFMLRCKKNKNKKNLLLLLSNTDWIHLKIIKAMHDITFTILDYFAIIQILVFQATNGLSDCLSLSAFSQFVLKCRVCFILASLNRCSLVQTYTKRSSAKFMLFL